MAANLQEVNKTVKTSYKETAMQNVRAWLEGLNFKCYASDFEKNGWDDINIVSTMTEEDFKDFILKPGHVRKLIVEVENLIQEIKKEEKKQILAKSVDSWLKEINFECYASDFEKNGWDDIKIVSTMTEEDFKDFILKPGHVRKLSVELENLNEKLQMEATEKFLQSIYF